MTKTCFDCLNCKTQNGGCKCKMGYFDFDDMPTLYEMDFEKLPLQCGEFDDMDGEVCDG